MASLAVVLGMPRAWNTTKVASGACCSTILARMARNPSNGSRVLRPRRHKGRDAAGRLAHVGRLGAILAKMDRDAEEEARRQQAASAARREAERDQHRSAAMPDAAEVMQLKRTIDCAAEGERLLEQMFAAFTAHTSAQAARARISTIFGSAQNARQTLRREGEAVSKPLPKQPTIRDAPEGAIAFAAIIQQVIGLRRH